MKIAVTGYAHPFGEVGGYGAERIIWYLMQELKAMGHEVTVFTVPGCEFPGFEYIKIPVPWSDMEDLYWNTIKQYEASTGTKFDMIHSFMASGYINEEMRQTRNYCLSLFFGFTRWKENIISPSKKINQVYGDHMTIIYYGIPEQVYTEPGMAPKDYLTWLGRGDSGKAPDIAIEVAKRAGKKLILMGPSYHYPYFMEKVWPHIDNDKVIWLRGVGDDVKVRVLKNSLAFLSPNWNHFHEMFGIVNIEALACGCPVIGWGRTTETSAINLKPNGEIIEHGVHGFINEYEDYSEEERERSINNAVEYVKRIGEIDRNKCRQLYLDRFTARGMAEKTVRYYDIVQQRKHIYNVTGDL